MYFHFFIASSATAIKICVITAGIYKSTIRKKNKTDDKIVLWAKTKLNSIEVLISKALIDSSISHDEFLSVNNMIKEYDDIKKTKILIMNNYVRYD